jgi:putative sterol carrier protein
VALYLSDEWLAEIEQAAQSSDDLRRAAAAGPLTVQQVVTGGPDGEVTFYVELASDGVTVARGRSDDADVTFTQDHGTAAAIGRGELSAQAAFMAGRLRVGGNLTLLMERQRDLGGIDDLFDAVRARTDYGTPAVS